jgi:hypothetical protein
LDLGGVPRFASQWQAAQIRSAELNHDGITSECSAPMFKSDMADDDDRAAFLAKSVIILGATEITLLAVAQSVRRKGTGSSW